MIRLKHLIVQAAAILRQPSAILVVFLLFAGGCATHRDLGRERLETLPYHYTQFDMELAWQVRQAGAQTIIEGELKNVRYAYMNDIEVWVAALAPSGRALTRGVSFVIPHELRRDETAPFTVKLPVRAESGTVLRFTYRYTGSDGGGRDEGGDGVNWMQSFDTAAP